MKKNKPDAWREIKMGASSPMAGMRFLRDYPSLLGSFVIPVLINTLVYSAGAYLFFTNLGPLLHGVLGEAQVWYMKMLFYAAGLVLGAVFALVLVFTFTAVGMIVAGPFLERISQKVDEIRLGFDPAPPSESFFKDIVVSCVSQIKKLMVFLAIQAACLVIYLAPIIGPLVAPPVQITVSFLFLAWEFWDFPMDRRKMDFAAKKAFIREHAAAALAFGAVCFCYLFVPLLNFVLMPASVAGATILVSNLLGEEEPQGG